LIVLTVRTVVITTSVKNAESQKKIWALWLALQYADSRATPTARVEPRSRVQRTLPRGWSALNAALGVAIFGILLVYARELSELGSGAAVALIGAFIFVAGSVIGVAAVQQRQVTRSAGGYGLNVDI
jgi:hypothetical protein